MSDAPDGRSDSRTDHIDGAPKRTTTRESDFKPALPGQQRTAGKKIAPFEMLRVEVVGKLDGSAIERIVASESVQPDGDISFGTRGRFHVEGLTVAEAEKAIASQLFKNVEDPKVQVVRVGVSTPKWARTGPFKIQEGDQLRVILNEVPADVRGGKEFKVDWDGLPLGATYGRTQVIGLTLRQAEEAIAAHLKQFAEDPKVAVTLHDFAPPTGPSSPVDKAQPAAGERASTARIPDTIEPGDILNIEVQGAPDGAQVRPVAVVEPDGNVALGAQYGRVNVKGLTMIQAENAIRKHLEKTLQGTAVQVTYAGHSADWAPGRQDKAADAQTGRRAAANPFNTLTTAATAQNPNGPTVSPYLNLLKPAEGQFAGIEELRQQIKALERQNEQLLQAIKKLQK